MSRKSEVILVITAIAAVVFVGIALSTNTQQIVTKDKFQTSKDGAVALSAKKVQTTVEVQVKKIGNLIESFTYQEPYSADNSGNTWTGLPPSIALSPDGMKVAYSDTTGLRVLDLATRVNRVVRTHLDSNPNDTYKDTSTKFLNPIWFPDSKYLLYYQTAYEGSRIGIVDVLTGAYNDSALTISPSSIEIFEVKGKTYIIYYTSQNNDIYGGVPGLFVAEFSSIQNIKFYNIDELFSLTNQ